MVQVRADGTSSATPTSPPSPALLASVGAKAPPSAFTGPGVVAARSALDLHEGIWDPPAKKRIADPLESGCQRWPSGFLLRWSRGELSGYVEGRCRATNLCPYCRILAVIETAEMLVLDAMEHAPTLWIVLTAREHLTRPDTYSHLKQLRLSLRKRWPSIEWFVQVEFQKRGALHLNLLIKGVPSDDAGALLERASKTWCRRVDALPVGQHIEEMTSARAVTRYLQKELVHGLKREQAPPIGWRGHRTSQTRGYLVRPASQMREEARASLRYKRKLRKVAAAAPDLDAGTVIDIVDELLVMDAEKEWRVVQVPPVWAEQILGAEPVKRAALHDSLKRARSTRLAGQCLAAGEGPSERLTGR